MSDRITKFISALDDKTRKRLRERLEELRMDPRAVHDIKKLQGRGNDVYRLRVGSIRIIYRLANDIVEVIDIDYRGHIKY